MSALRANVVDAIWHAVEAPIPQPIDEHPSGCRQPRVDDRICLCGILIRLAAGCSRTTVEALMDDVVSPHSFGQLRRNTDRRSEHRDAQLTLATSG